jgi:hypothetical protein
VGLAAKGQGSEHKKKPDPSGKPSFGMIVLDFILQPV